jgi:UDP-glucose 4-epimerase
MPTKVLLAGGSGLVGNSLVKLLSKSDLDLTVISRAKPEKKVKFIEHDAMQPFSSLKEKLEGSYDVLIINSGYFKESGNFPDLDSIFRVNLAYTSNLLEFARTAGVKKILYTSTLAFLQKPLQKEINEDHPVAAGSNYAMSKYLAESLAHSFCKENGIKFFSFRITSPVNTEKPEWHKNVLKKWAELAAGKKDLIVIGKGKRQQNFISTQNIAEIYSQAIEKDLPDGIYVLAAPAALSMQALAELFAEKFGVNVTFDAATAEDPSFKNISTKKLESVFDTSSMMNSSRTIKKLLKEL